MSFSAVGCWCRSWAENELSGKAKQAAAASSESSELVTYVPLSPEGQRLADFAVAALAFEPGLVVAATDSTALVTELASRHPPLNSTGVPVSEGLRPIDAQF